MLQVNSVISGLTMGKHKKTKAQKKLADFRHDKEHVVHLPETPTTPSPVPIAYTYTSSAEPAATTSYSLTHGLEKTLIVSSVIILFQLLLFILLHNHALVLPLVSLRY